MCEMSKLLHGFLLHFPDICEDQNQPLNLSRKFCNLWRQISYRLSRIPRLAVRWYFDRFMIFCDFWISLLMKARFSRIMNSLNGWSIHLGRGWMRKKAEESPWSHHVYVDTWSAPSDELLPVIIHTLLAELASTSSLVSTWSVLFFPFSFSVVKLKLGRVKMLNSEVSCKQTCVHASLFSSEWKWEK